MPYMWITRINVLSIDIDLKSVLNFISQNIWGIVLIFVGIIILLKIDAILSIMAALKTKLSKKGKKDDSKVKPFVRYHKGRQKEVINVEYKVKK